MNTQLIANVDTSVGTAMPGGGINRFSEGDTHCLTFSDADRAIAATERLAQAWDLFDRREQVNCQLVAALHKGVLYLYRSYAYSADLNIVAGIVDLNRSQSQSGSAIFVTSAVQRELTGTPWFTRFRRVEMGLGDRNQLAGIEVFRLADAERVLDRLLELGVQNVAEGDDDAHREAILALVQLRTA